MHAATPPVALGAPGRPLSLEALEDVARRRRAVVFDEEARARVVASRAAIDRITHAGDLGPRVYGVNTGFGALSETRISASDVRQLQKNLVQSHATGVGPPLGVAEVGGCCSSGLRCSPWDAAGCGPTSSMSSFKCSLVASTRAYPRKAPSALRGTSRPSRTLRSR